MARLLILGGGCRGVLLAREMAPRGHAARIVTRAERRRAQIEAAGAECWIGDLDRLASLRGVLESVTIVCWLLGGAAGGEEQVRALHGTRLRAFLESAIDTTVRGVLYEAAGTVAAETLAAGERTAAGMADANAMPLEILRADPRELRGWLEQARAAVDSLLAPPSRALAPDTLSSSNPP